MVRRIDWDSQIGRRLKLRDLHVFSTVVERGSMAKAAQQLGVTQPAVSEVIGNLEHALGVRLLDRSTKGIEPTIYGDVLLRRSVTVFDELKQSIRDIEFLSDPAVGDLRVGFTDAFSASILPDTLMRFSRQYPHVAVHLDDVSARTNEAPGPGLRERKYDCVLQRLFMQFSAEHTVDDLNVEMLFENKFVVMAGAANTRWADHRKIDLAELVNEPWILPPPNTWDHESVTGAFRARGLQAPSASFFTTSISLRTRLVCSGPYLTAIASSVIRRLQAEGSAVTTLPVEFAAPSWAAAIVTLKNRTLGPAAERFIACARDVAKLYRKLPDRVSLKGQTP
jgi:DNA-binding transcriptional LysR family regulator